MFNLSLFVERLKELIDDSGLSKDDILQDLSLNRTTLNRYLVGTRVPSLTTMIKIADLFNCTMDFLLGLKDDYSSKSFKKCPPFNIQLTNFLNYFKTNKYQFQKKTGINESIIYGWQSGKHIPSIDNIVKIAETYECSVDFVVGRE